jgi:hypothetical protein
VGYSRSVATGQAGAGEARAEDPGEAELPEVKPRLEAVCRSLVRLAASKGLTKGESGFEDEVGWSNADGPAHVAPKAAGSAIRERMNGDDRGLDG